MSKSPFFPSTKFPWSSTGRRLGCWPKAFPPCFAGVPVVSAPGALRRGPHRSRTAEPRRSGRWRPSEISGRCILGRGFHGHEGTPISLDGLFHGICHWNGWFGRLWSYLYNTLSNFDESFTGIPWIFGKSLMFFWQSALIHYFVGRISRSLWKDWWGLGLWFNLMKHVSATFWTWMLRNSTALESPSV